ncbi:MAG: hypothetical protein JWQ04_1696, partial [Pedosphaera sp.]|nr:hypothetical protein [Pedosphaera sp.]
DTAVWPVYRLVRWETSIINPSFISFAKVSLVRTPGLGQQKLLSSHGQLHGGGDKVGEPAPVLAQYDV